MYSVDLDLQSFFSYLSSLQVVARYNTYLNGMNSQNQMPAFTWRTTFEPKAIINDWKQLQLDISRNYLIEYKIS